MNSRGKHKLPARLEAARRRFERWRRTRRGNSRIPAPLWTSATALAEAYGLCRTARVLRLDYNALKKRINLAQPKDASEPQTATAFVELVPPQGGCFPECLVELEDPRGAKMRIRLTGQPSSELVAAVSQAFFGAGS
jgi:hypothetical protein